MNQAYHLLAAIILSGVLAIAIVECAPKWAVKVQAEEKKTLRRSLRTWSK